MTREPVVRMRGTHTTGPYGGDDVDWTSPTEATYAGNVQPFTTAERLADPRVSTALKVWLWLEPDGVDVIAGDRVRWRGVVYEVDGDPALWDSAPGPSSHVALVVRRVREGG